MTLLRNAHPYTNSQFLKIDLLAKYFSSTAENTWRPSLIAFPHYQTYPSRAHKVNHLCRTIMLIDMMQWLQGQAPFPGNSKNSIIQIMNHTLGMQLEAMQSL